MLPMDGKCMKHEIETWAVYYVHRVDVEDGAPAYVSSEQNSLQAERTLSIAAAYLPMVDHCPELEPLPFHAIRTPLNSSLCSKEFPKLKHPDSCVSLVEMVASITPA